MLPLPTGTITFLFTDIEGSTRLWERFPEAMHLALARHDLLLREAIEQNRGYIFKTVGDAFCAAFVTAADALDAALESQVALQAESWGETGPLRSRMGIHTGQAEEREGDYFGQTLNRTARLDALAHGGQILLSQATYELVRDLLPKDVELLSLGTHRLKDLNRAEAVYQVVHPALPADFPPLRSLGSFPHNLPIQMTSFIGREREMEEVKRLLASSSLVTLLGPGGTGKTRLSLQVGAELLEQFPDGIRFVELAPLTDSAQVAKTIATVIGVKEEADVSLTKVLIEYFKSRTLLLILDNCEHLVAACAVFAQTLLQSCPHLRILASSREGFNIPGETLYRVPSLQIPDPKSESTLEALTQFEAVRLFMDRAASIQPAFAVTRQNVPALAQLCARLDGIPLAIELAAARVRSLSVEEINGKLDNCFRLLTGGSRTALPRQQTLRALIDWSYDLLNAPERSLLCRLSVFCGGWTLEAAEVVCAGEEIEAWEILDLLTSLNDKSLTVAEQEEGQTRYRLLETVRQYARDRLQERGESEIGQKQHLAYFLQFAEENSRLLSGVEEQAGLAHLESEQDNLRSALEWALDHAPSSALKLTVVLGKFWYLGGHLREGRDYLERALAGTNATEDREFRAQALFHAGRLMLEQGDYGTARAMLAESLQVCREIGDRRGMAMALNSLGTIEYQQEKYAEARPLLEESLALHREMDNMIGIAGALLNLGTVLRFLGEQELSWEYQQESLALYEAVGNRRGVANILINQGNACEHRGEIDRAYALLEKSLRIGQELEDNWYIAYSLSALANIALERGDYDRAQDMAQTALGITRRIGDRGLSANLLSTTGQIACKKEEYVLAHSLLGESLTVCLELEQAMASAVLLEKIANLLMESGRNGGTGEQLLGGGRAARLLGAAHELRGGNSLSVSKRDLEERERWIASARAILGEEEFAIAWAEGRTLTLAGAVALALQTDDRPTAEMGRTV